MEPEKLEEMICEVRSKRPSGLYRWWERKWWLMIRKQGGTIRRVNKMRLTV